MFHVEQHSLPVQSSSLRAAAYSRRRVFHVEHRSVAVASVLLFHVERPVPLKPFLTLDVQEFSQLQLRST
jgi:hypothetical protein